MKNRIALLLVALMLFSYANAETEITFQSIPWLSDDLTTMKYLSDAGLLRTNIEHYVFSKDGAIIITENEQLNYQPNTIPEYGKCCYSVNLEEYVKGRIAGSSVETIIPVFAYNGEYELIAIQVKLNNTNFSELKKKLTQVYGDGESKEIKEETIESIIWKGENDSAVLLYTESDGIEYTLVYGRLDAGAILANCLISNPDDVNGL